jgi:hypothetical protein
MAIGLVMDTVVVVARGRASTPSGSVLGCMRIVSDIATAGGAVGAGGAVAFTGR